MPLTLPVQLEELVKDRASRCGQTPMEYLSQLVEEDIQPPAGPQTITSMQQLEGALVEGMDGELSKPVTEQTWAERRKRIETAGSRCNSDATANP